MSQDAKSEKKPGGRGASVVSLAGERCVAEGCGKKMSRAEFCDEHFTWYKEGLLDSKGQRPKDFDKKYIAFSNRTKAA